MKTWDDYKDHVSAIDPAIAKDIKETEEIAVIVSAMCGIPQSSVARIDSCKTTPNLGTLFNIFQHLGLTLSVSQTEPLL